MEFYVMIARSVTYAQRIQRELRRAGIRAALFRAPLELTGGAGCSYAVRIAAEALLPALRILRASRLDAVRILKTDGIRATEVSYDLL